MKLFRDTLKNPVGEYSRKSLILMVSFFLTMGIGLYIAVSDLIPNLDLSNAVVEVFQSLLFFVSTLAGITVADKKLANKKTEEDA